MSTIPSLESYPMAIDPRPLSERLTPGERVAEALRLHAEDSDAEDVSKAESQPVDDGYLGMKPLTGIYHGFRDNHNIRSVATNDFKRMVLAQSAALASMSSSASTSSVAAPAAASSSSSSSSLSSSSSSSLSAPAAAAPVAAAAPAAEPEDEKKKKSEKALFKAARLRTTLQDADVGSGDLKYSDDIRNVFTDTMSEELRLLHSVCEFLTLRVERKTVTGATGTRAKMLVCYLRKKFDVDRSSEGDFDVIEVVAKRIARFKVDCKVYKRPADDSEEVDVEYKVGDLALAKEIIKIVFDQLAEIRENCFDAHLEFMKHQENKTEEASKKRKARAQSKGEPALKKSKPASKSA